MLQQIQKCFLGYLSDLMWSNQQLIKQNPTVTIVVVVHHFKFMIYVYLSF